MTPLEIISRDYLLKTVKYYDGDDCVVKNYKDFEDEIVFWKVMLYEACNIRPGSNIAVYDRTIRFNYCTLFLAAAELGARLIVIPDYPVEGTPRNDKMDRFVEVYGRLDLCIFDDSAGTSQALIDLTNYYGNMTIVKTMLDTYEIQDHKNYELMSTTVFAKPEDIFIITTTSGSSGEPKLIPFLHRQMYRNGKRNVKVLGFNPEDRAYHTRNMHHPFVLTDFFLPSLCGINHHYSIPFISAFENDQAILKALDFINTHKINQIAFSSRAAMESLLLYMSDNNLQFEHEFNIIVGGQYVPKKYLEYVKKTNVTKIIANLGTSETMAPLLMKHITPQDDPDTYDEQFLGYPPDDTYQFRLEGERLLVACPSLYEGYKQLDDRFSGDTVNGFYHLGRENFYRIDHIEFKLSDVVQVVKDTFTGDFDMCADTKYQNLYLAVWGGDIDFAAVNSAMQRRLMVTFRDYDYLDKSKFTTGIKLDQIAIRNHFRRRNS